MSDARPQGSDRGDNRVRGQQQSSTIVGLVLSRSDFIVEELDHDGEPFLKADCPSCRESWFQSPWSTLTNSPALKIVERRADSHNSGHLYRLHEGVRQRAQERVEKRDSLLPCGHSGLSNLRGQEGYQCGYEGCGRRFVRGGGDGFVEVTADE